jgi:hypothetical protein
VAPFEFVGEVLATVASTAAASRSATWIRGERSWIDATSAAIVAIWRAASGSWAIAAGLRRQIPRPVLFLMTTFGGRSYWRCSAAAWD